MESFYRYHRRRLGFLMDCDVPAGGAHGWHEPAVHALDSLDRTVLADLSTSWHLSHALSSPCLKLGLLWLAEVCDVVEWREHVWGLYWLGMPEHHDVNPLGAERALPPTFRAGQSEMRCTHCIQRLVVLASLSLLSGVRPSELVEWMWARIVDGAQLVVLPNVIGIGLYAEGGRMATGPDACPVTTLDWSFLDTHRERFLRNPRLTQQVRGLDRLADVDAVRSRTAEVLAALDAGAL